MTLHELNVAAAETAHRALLSCCGSIVWAEQMIARRPFESVKHLQDASEAIWCSLSRADWLEAFAAHPRIGERSSSKWSAQEQQGVSGSRADVVTAIGKMNAEYERKFGYIFLVCATGKFANEIRSLIEARMTNDPATELRIAAAEQAKIMHLRLHKLLIE